LALQKEYEKAPDVTRTRLYLEAMEKILPKLQLYIIDSDKGTAWPLTSKVTGPYHNFNQPRSSGLPSPTIDSPADGAECGIRVIQEGS